MIPFLDLWYLGWNVLIHLITHSYSLCFRPLTRTFSWCHKLPRLISNISVIVFVLSCEWHIWKTDIFAKWESGWKITVASTPPTLKVLFHQIVFVPTVDIIVDTFGIFQISILSCVDIVVFYIQSVFPQYLCLLKVCFLLPSETLICAVCYGSPVARNAWKWLASCLTCPSSI